MFEKPKLICTNCRAELTSMGDVSDVRCLGLSIFGRCVACGESLCVNSLWRPTEVQEPVDEDVSDMTVRAIWISDT